MSDTALVEIRIVDRTGQIVFNQILNVERYTWECWPDQHRANLAMEVSAEVAATLHSGRAQKLR